MDTIKINPHAKVPSAAQDYWVMVCEALRDQLYRLAVQKCLGVEDIRCLRMAVWEIKTLHTTCLLFDDKLEAQREKLSS